MDTQQSGPSPSKIHKIKRDVSNKYGKIPLLRKLQPKAAFIIFVLAVVNVVVWAAVGVVLHFHSALTGTAVLAYTFGLRHALDADHISAIDLMTRRLIASGQKPVTVGTWFSLGHSTIVIITSVVVAATASAISSKFNRFSFIGGIVGTSVSAAFLLILGLANAYILYLLVRQVKRILKSQQTQGGQTPTTLNFEGGGVFFRVFKRLFKLIDRPWKMYPLGVLFGLGFDTSSEIALLGISSIQATNGTSLWLILIFPILFTSGMCLIDTTDGALMLCLYSSVSLARDTLAIAYYNVVLTGITVVVACVIGVVQILALVVAVVGEDKLTGQKGAAGSFWRGAVAVNDNYDVVGGVICGLFVVSGIGSVLLYKPWRRRVSRGSGYDNVQDDHGTVAVEDDGQSGAQDLENSARRDVGLLVSSGQGSSTGDAYKGQKDGKKTAEAHIMDLGP